MQCAGTTEGGETVGGSSSSNEFSPGWGSAEMGVQVGCAINVHRDTVTALAPKGRA
jgi:hypothetical protein